MPATNFFPSSGPGSAPNTETMQANPGKSGGLLEEEEITQDPLEILVPLGVLVLLGVAVTFVTFNVQAHFDTVSHDTSNLVLPGLLVLLVTGGGMSYLFLAAKGHEFSAETRNNLEMAPALLGGLLALGTWATNLFPA